MKTVSETQLKGFHVDQSARRRFLRSSFRYGGIGGLLFAASIMFLMFYGFRVDQKLAIGVIVLGVAGFLFELAINLLARRREVACSKCSTALDKCKNSDRPDDTEYIYVCRACKNYFKVRYADEPSDYS